MDMTLRLNNACGVDHMPTAATQTTKTQSSNLVVIEEAPQLEPGKVRQNASLPRARSTRNVGRFEIGMPGRNHLHPQVSLFCTVKTMFGSGATPSSAALTRRTSHLDSVHPPTE